MGIDLAALRFLLDSRLRMGPFDKTLQIGHQGIHLRPDQREYTDAIIRRSGLGTSTEALIGGESYADRLFLNLGASEVQTMDASSYEGATVVHDLNTPVPANLHASYDTIYDGGSIEHIFNVPMVVANYVAMLREGGRLLIATVANNYLGHGFYQFSPEWAYRTFGPDSGCAVETCYLMGYDETGELMPASDPMRERRRIETFTTPIATYLMIAARRINDRPFAARPQQSDYVTSWRA